MMHSKIRINYLRLFLGALAASVALFAGEIVFIGIMGSRLMAAREAAGLPNFVPQPLLSLTELILTGTCIVWLYVSIRPRYGAGIATAIKAGVGAWFGVVMLSTIHTMGEGFGFPPLLLVEVALVILPVFIISSCIGGLVYTE